MQGKDFPFLKIGKTFLKTFLKNAKNVSKKIYSDILSLQKNQFRI
jgi:hypothetical protein